MTMTEVHGTCDERFTAMRDLLAANLASGADLGASVAVTLDGEPVVDLWGGWADTDETVPWTQDTITNVWSTTKTMTSLSALVLVERGQLDVYAPGGRVLAGVRRERQGQDRGAPPDVALVGRVGAGRSRSWSTTSSTGRSRRRCSPPRRRGGSRARHPATTR